MADNGKKKEIFHPSSNLDPELQRELDEALEGMSLEDVLAAEEEKERTPAGAGKGVKRGVVAGIQGDFIFVDMGGKSQGLLPATQYGDDEPLPAVGDSIEVTAADVGLRLVTTGTRSNFDVLRHKLRWGEGPLA